MKAWCGGGGFLNGKAVQQTSFLGGREKPRHAFTRLETTRSAGGKNVDTLKRRLLRWSGRANQHARGRSAVQEHTRAGQRGSGRGGFAGAAPLMPGRYHPQRERAFPTRGGFRYAEARPAWRKSYVPPLCRPRACPPHHPGDGRFRKFPALNGHPGKAMVVGMDFPRRRSNAVRHFARGS